MKTLTQKKHKLAKILLNQSMITGLFLLLTYNPVFAQNIPKKWSTNNYRPPTNIGRPINSLPGGVRGDLLTLMPLLPQVENTYFGVTVKPYPTFLTYIPEIELPVKYAQFSLEDKEGNEIYKTDFILQTSNQIISISLPNNAGLAPLAIDEDYQWTFSIFDDFLRINSPKITSSGWIRRVELPLELQSNSHYLMTETKPDKINQSRLYAESGIWYDSAASLAQLYRDYPEDLEIKEDWEKLLKSAQLNNLLGVPLFSSNQFN